MKLLNLILLKGKTQLTKCTISDNDLVIVEEVEEPEFWSDKENFISGFYKTASSGILKVDNVLNDEYQYNVFATKKQVKSALAMARISQIMANDVEHFGGVITDEEWGKDLTIDKYAICRLNNAISLMFSYLEYHFLAFHTETQRDLFLEKYRNLVQDYLMID